MRVAFLSAANSVHTLRWVNGLAGRGLEVHLISAHESGEGLDGRVQFHRLARRPPAAYLLCGHELTTRLRQIAPDLLNAHYASGYGTLARISGFRPLLLSVWGSDVYEFPQSSPLHRWLIRGNLRAASAIASTSHCMARQVAELFEHPSVFVTPFGVDPQAFAPGRVGGPSGQVVIGTVKTLTPKYGIDLLIDAFALALQRAGTTMDLRLEITGGGTDDTALRQRVDRLGLSRRVTFHGPVPHVRVPEMLARLDIFAALSRDDSESFGVAAVEAAACGKPVVVSDVDGFVEVVRAGETGLVVPRENVTSAADALLRLAGDADLRATLGAAARTHMLQHYTWEHSLDRMIDAYRRVISG